MSDDPEDDDLDADSGDGASMDGFLEALAVSLRPEEIDHARHEFILARALGEEALEDAEPEASDAEIRRAERFRALLAGDRHASVFAGAAPTDEELRLVMLARALRLAYAPSAIDQVTNERLLRPALALPTRLAVRRYVAATAFVLVAAAAAVFGLFLRSDKPAGSARADVHPASMIGAHTTTTLFDPAEPFPRVGGTTSRVDKIEASRDREMRENLFSSWGVE